MSDEIILGIESAIEGGSIAVQANGVIVDTWVGDRNVSRAEDLLPNIDRLLTRNRIAVDDIGKIIVSLGPGSFTGIKIGIATVLGLRASLGVDCLGTSSLEALSLLSNDDSVLVAVPVGRGSVCTQKFVRGTSVSAPELIETEQFTAGLQQKGSRCILHGSLADKEYFPDALDAGFNVAQYLCNAAESRFARSDLKPLFVERNFGSIK